MTTAVQVRLDRSKGFSTCHGERAPSDPHAGVVFIQDGLPYDGDGFLMQETVKVVCSDKEKAHAARLIEKAQKALAARSPETGDSGGSDDSLGERDPAQVNIEAWLRGEQRVEWQTLLRAVKARYGKSGINNKLNLLLFLVEDEKVVPASQLDPQLKLLLDQG